MSVKARNNGFSQDYVKDETEDERPVGILKSSNELEELPEVERERYITLILLYIDYYNNYNIIKVTLF